MSPTMVCCVMSLYFDAKANVLTNDITWSVFKLFCCMCQSYPASPSFFSVVICQLVSALIPFIYWICWQPIPFYLVFDRIAKSLYTYLSDAGLPLGLRLAPQKCELICFHRPDTIDKSTLPQIKLSEHVLPWKSSVVYLSSRFSENGSTLAAVKHRICCMESVVTCQLRPQGLLPFCYFRFLLKHQTRIWQPKIVAKK